MKTGQKNRALTQRTETLSITGTHVTRTKAFTMQL